MTLKWNGNQVKNSVRGSVDQLVFRVAHALRNEAVRLVQTGSRSGRIYRRGRKTHQASAPGEPPKTDTGALVRSMRVDHRPGTGRASFVVGAEYAARLEFGTAKMAARPFVRPAIENVKAKMPEFMRSVTVKVEK